MLDRASNTQQMQRARGAARITFEHKYGECKLADLYQAGCLKALLPKTHHQTPEVVFVNTAGGVTGGDTLDISCSAWANTEVTLTSQTAERVYRSNGGDAQIRVDLKAGENAKLFWCPQETIIFDDACLKRKLDVELDASGSALLLESFMLGRQAMGETVNNCKISDQWRVRLDGKLVFAEALRIEDASFLKSNASLGENLAFATLVLVERGAEDKLDQLRQMLDGSDCRAAASAWPNVLVARFVHANAFALRQVIIPILEKFNNKPLPRVWQL